MELKEFTEQEVEILIEAVDAWVDKEFSGEIMGSLLTMALGNNAPPEVKEKLKQQQEEEYAKSKRAKVLRKEQAIFIKAKLLKTRDSIVASKI